MTRRPANPLRLFPLLLLCLALAACGDKPAAPAAGGHDDHEGHADEDGGHDHAAKHGGAMVVSSDHKAHFEFVHDDEAGLVKLWIYDGELAPVVIKQAPVINVPADSGPVQVKGQAPDGASSSSEWHFAHKALIGHVHGARLRLAVGTATYTPDLPDVHDEHADEDHDGHAHDGDADDGHDHDAHDHEGEGPHHGIVQPFFAEDGTEAGHIEIKLHDDKGDLELWLGKDEAMKQPFDIQVGSAVSILFVSLDNRQVPLHVRDAEKNEDEDGVAHIRAGNTDYFVFPGDTGADATWLQGEAFKAKVAIAFTSGAKLFKTKAFELTPHDH